jgi:hypothetical protein
MQHRRTILVILSVFSVLFCLQFAGIGFPALQAKSRPNISAAVALAAAAPRVAWKRFAKLTPSDGQIGDIFGSAVAIDGDVIVVGNETANIGKNIQQGAAYIFVKPSNGWHDMTQTAKLTASDGQYNDSFGHSVAIRGDTIAIGAYCHLAQLGSCPGAVYVFKKPEIGWTDMTQTAELTASDDHSQYGYDLGWSVAIGPDYTITSGAVASVNFAGAVYVFLKPPNGWRDKTQDAELTASDGQPFDGLGNSVSYNDNTVAAGAPNWPNGGNQGAGYIYVKPSTGWETTTETARFIDPDRRGGDYFADSVSLDADADILGSGTPGATINGKYAQGAVYLFKKSNDDWKNAPAVKLTAFNGRARDALGVAVSVEEFRTAAGASGYANNAGATYLYAKPTLGWKTTSMYNTRLTDVGGNFFGAALALKNNVLVVGAYLDYPAGAAYVYGPGD